MIRGIVVYTRLVLASWTLLTRLSLVDSELSSFDFLTVHSFDHCSHISLSNVYETKTFFTTCFTVSWPEKVSYWSDFFENCTEILCIDAERDITNE